MRSEASTAGNLGLLLRAKGIDRKVLSGVRGKEEGVIPREEEYRPLVDRFSGCPDCL